MEAGNWCDATEEGRQYRYIENANDSPDGSGPEPGSEVGEQEDYER